MRYVVQWSPKPYVWHTESQHEDYHQAITSAQALTREHLRIIDRKKHLILAVRPITPQYNTNREERDQLHKRLNRARYIKRPER